MDEERTDPVDQSDGTSTPPDLDLMGNEKRRTVVGEQYGATVRKQLTVYGVFLAVSIGLVIAFLTVVSSIDNAEIPLEDTAPWTQASAEQVVPRDVDFPRNGPDNTIPADEIGKAPEPSTSDAQTGN